MVRAKYEDGQKINGILFLREVQQRRNIRRGLFQCPLCPKTFETDISQILGGHTKSCGCLRKIKNHEPVIKHGHCKRVRTSEYNSYSQMIGRCYNHGNKDYKLYGGRGIRVCDRWKDDFKNFIDDMGQKPGKGYSIDRIDNNGIYELSNCRWANIFEQNNNKRNNVLLTYMGKTQTQEQWAREIGLDGTTIKKRRHKGWPIDQILSKAMHA